MILILLSLAMPLRRSSPPWTVQERREPYIVADELRQHIAYPYFEDKPGRQGDLKRLLKHGAERIAGITRVSLSCGGANIGEAWSRLLRHTGPKNGWRNECCPLLEEPRG